jgi:NAD(P)-dependent dehydrogenase (short-subunit alcohol dehydrogenase family)
MGAATVRAFVRSGVTRLAIADIQESKLRAIANDLHTAHSKLEILPLVCNVADEISVAAMVKATVAVHGRIDYAVNCAGVMGEVGPMGQVPTEGYRRIVGTNQDGIL